MVTPFIQHLHDILGNDSVSTTGSTREYYGKDAASDFVPDASVVCFPRSTAEVQKIVEAANTFSTPLIPSGGRTGLCGGATATAGECVVSLEKLNKVLEVSEGDQFMRCEAGVKTHDAKEAARAHGLTIPVSFASEGSSQIGGNIATNAGGMHVIRYGLLRNWVLGLTVVTGEGKILRIGGRLYKNQTGYDLKNLFVGSEGTLGFITEATIALSPVPTGVTRSLCALSSFESALPVLTAAKKKFLSSLSAVEFFERSALERVTKHHSLRDPFSDPHEVYLLLELEREDEALLEEFEDFYSPLFESGDVVDVVIGQNSKQSEELLQLREYIGETLNAHYSPHKNDIAVPISMLPEFISKLRELLASSYPAVVPVLFGHIGDGNIHVNLLKPENLTMEAYAKLCKEKIDPDIYRLVLEYEGSISAEHGVGLLKRDILPQAKTPEEISYMKALKKVFDPHGVMNPGKVL